MIVFVPILGIWNPDMKFMKTSNRNYRIFVIYFFSRVSVRIKELFISSPSSLSASKNVLIFSSSSLKLASFILSTN